MTAARARVEAEPVEWYRKAACLGVKNADPIFFQPVGSSYEEARAICHRCPVRDECLDEALAQEHGTFGYGMRGGFDPEQRRKISRSRARIRRDQVKVRAPRRPVGPESRKAGRLSLMQSIAADGGSIEDAAAELGVTRPALLKWAHRHNQIELYARLAKARMGERVPSKVTAEKAGQLAEGGATVDEAVQALGMVNASLYMALHRAKRKDVWAALTANAVASKAAS